MKSIAGILVVLALLAGALVLTGCAGLLTAPTAAGGTPSAGGDSSGDRLAPLVTLAVPTRTPVTTPTPGILAEQAANFFEQTGLSEQTVERLSNSDWLNLAISLLIVVVGYLLGTWVIRRLFPRLVRRTKNELDDQLLEVSGNLIRWLVVVLTLRYATNRLAFNSPTIKTLLLDLYFFLALYIFSLILWRLIDLAARQVREQMERQGYASRFESLLRLGIWVARLGVIILALTLILNHYAVDITGIAIFLAILVVAISLASRDTINDMIAGLIILFDRPFRVGDRIQILDLNTNGDVIDIGLRSTHILTTNNRMVILPNSKISKDMIVNFSYPDESYYDSTDIQVAYENDIDKITQVLREVIPEVEGIQADRGLDLFLVDFLETAIVFRIGYWMASARDSAMMHDRVNRAAITTLRAQGVLLPYRKADLSVDLGADQAG